MATKNRRKDDQVVSPFNDPAFRRHSVNFDDIETQRRFEQNLIRFDIPDEARITDLISNVSIGGGGGGQGCYWTKEGNNLVYYDGNVGVGVHPHNNDFEVRGNILIEAVDEAPYLEIRNWSDTARDPLIKWSVGATPATRFVTGIDDSDSDKWKIANLSALGTLAESQGAYGEVLVFFHDYDDNLCFVSLDDFSTDGIIYNGISGSGAGEFNTPRSMTCDGIYIYITDNSESKIQKFDIASGLYVSSVVVHRPWGICYWNGYLYTMNNSSIAGVGYRLYKIDASTMLEVAHYDFEAGSADDRFNGPRGISTDGTSLYICDASNFRIKKCNMAGVYQAKVGATGTGDGQFGANSPTDCEVDGDYIYACDYTNTRIQVFDKSTMAFVAKHDTQVVDGKKGSPCSIAINDVYYYVNCNNDYPQNGYIEKYDIATRSYQAVYDTTVIAAHEDIGWSAEIAKYPSSGIKYGDLFVVHQDGAFIDHWPICRFVDDIRLVQDGDDEDGDYVGLRAPAAVGTSYTLTFPADLPAGQSHLSCSASGVLSFGQDVNTTASPSFVRLTLTQTTGTAPMTITSTTVVTNLNADLLDGQHGAYYGQAYITATASPGVSDDINQTPVAFTEGCIWVEQDSNTVWFCADNANGAAVWHGIDQDLLTTSAVNFAGATLSDNFTVYKDGACTISQYACDAANYVQLNLYRSRGTYASKTAVADEDYVGRIQFLAYSDNPALPYAVGIIECQVKSISGVTPYGALNISARDTGSIGIYLSDTQNIGLFTSTFGTDAAKVLALATGTAPSTAPADAFQMYSKDYAAGHAAPHFMLESGEEISLRDDGYYVDGVSVGGGGASAFTDLTDVDSDYTGDGGKFVKVNAAETGLEFVASSVAAHDILSASHGDATAGAVVAGDVIYGDNTPKWTRLAHGSDGDVLTLASGLPTWAAPSGGSAHAVLSATHSDSAASAVSRGSIIIGNSTPAWSELVVGTAGQVLTSDGTDVAWATPAEPGMYTLLNENFDALSTAAVHGQGSYTYFGTWTSTLVGSTTINIVAHPVSGKMLQIDGDTVTEGSSYSEILCTFIPGMAAGTRIRFKMRTSDITLGGKGIYIGQATKTPALQLYFRNTSKITFWNGSTATDLMNSANNTWYQVDIVIERGSTTYYASVYIDGVRMGAPKACGADTLSWLYIGVYVNTTGTASNVNFDFDDLQIGTNLFWNLVD